MSGEPPELTQKGRMIAATSPLGEDVLLLTGFHIEEEMSRPFRGVLELLSKTHDIDPKDIVGKAMGVTIELEKDKKRHFHGLVRTFEASGLENQGLRRYRAEIVPWLSMLELKQDCKIFLEKSAVEIAEQIFNDMGYTDFEKKLQGTPKKREFCVQYRETCFDFVSRLLEDEGIFYFFKHEEDKHTLVLADAASAYEECKEKEVKFTDGTLEEPHLVSWSHRWEIRPGVYVHRDYDFESPSTQLESKSNTVLEVPGVDKFEIYDYPGKYVKPPDGDAAAKLRMEEREATFSLVSSGGTCTSFTIGGKFTLKLYDPDPSQKDKSFVITSIVHDAQDEGYATGGTTGEYWNTFQCIPDDVPFRPERRTKAPRVEGTQTAVVVGPSGEELYLDKYGRAKIQFHWDRDGKKDEKSGIFVRVSQIWAGKGSGAYFNPRIGDEVLVDFMDGDPDRPIIVGGVHNATTMPPAELPANATRGGLKTRSSKGGGESDGHELRFEDKKDSEEIFFQSQKDFKRVVKNNDELEVGLDKKDPGDQKITVHNDRTITVKEGKQTVTIEKGDDVYEVKKGKHTVTIAEGDETLTVGKGKRTIAIDTGDDTLTVKGKRSASVDGDDELTVKSGNITIKASGGKITIDGATGIELKCGGNSIKIEPSGVTIKGTMVNIEGQAMLEAKAPMSTIKGDGMLTLKGGLTMIN